MPVYECVCPQCFHELEVPIPIDSQSNGGNIRSTHNWGIASFVWFTVITGVQACLRPFREGVDVKPAEKMQPLEEVIPTGPTEDSLNHAAVADQRIWYPRHWPEEESQPATTAQPGGRAPQEQAPNAARTFWPRSNFEWFLLVTVVQAFTVVPLVWILAVMVF
jgi:hypothetical protein